VHAVVGRRTPVTGPVRVVIADDEPLIRAGLRAIFEGARGIEVAAVAATERKPSPPAAGTAQTSS